MAHRLLRPASVAEAVALRTQYPDTRVIAGGTLAVAEQARRVNSAEGFLLLSGVGELQGIAVSDAGIRVGAQVTLRGLQEAAAAPMLDIALRSLASPQIRNRGTVGGNIAERRPDHTLSPCLIALGATIEIAGPSGSSELTMAEFISRGLAADELVTAVTIPGTAGFQRFTRIGMRNGPSYAVVSLAVHIDPVGRTVRSGMGAVGPTALPGAAADGFLADAIDWSSGAVPPGAAEEFGRLLVAGSAPMTDGRSTAEYRRHALGVMGRRIVEDWSGEAGHGN